MKKILAIFCLTVVTFTASAQNYGNNGDLTVTFGLVGGSNFAMFAVNSAYKQSIVNNFETVGSLGINADFKFNDYFSIRPCIFYAGKGGTLNAIYVDAGNNNVDVYDDYKLHYLEVPIHFIGHLPVGEGANIFLGAGPYFSYGLNGTNSQTLSSGDPVTYKIAYGKNGDFKSTDFGITSVIGFQAAKGWSVSGNLDLGATNIIQMNNTAIDVSQLKTVAFYFSFGYSF